MNISSLVEKKKKKEKNHMSEINWLIEREIQSTYFEGRRTFIHLCCHLNDVIIPVLHSQLSFGACQGILSVCGIV